MCAHENPVVLDHPITRDARAATTAALTIGSIPGQPAMSGRLASYLQSWLGVWPPPSEHAFVVTEERDRPGWDGRIRPVQGVTTPVGNLLSISPRLGDLFARIDAAQFFADLATPDAQTCISRALAAPVAVGSAILRWGESLSMLPAAAELGTWLPSTDPRLPAWLTEFREQVLVVLDGATVAAGVGIKRHSQTGYELAVGTEPHYRGRKYAQALVAQAARSIVARGGVPLYRHESHNIASARVADATGFPDRGWRTIDLAVVNL